LTPFIQISNLQFEDRVVVKKYKLFYCSLIFMTSSEILVCNDWVWKERKILKLLQFAKFLNIRILTTFHTLTKQHCKDWGSSTNGQLERFS